MAYRRASGAISVPTGRLASPLTASADGLPLVNGRYPGPVLVLELTPSQKQAIERFRTCHLERYGAMNRYTPYVFVLTREQARALRSRKGYSPDLFQVYETYRGFNDAGPHCNLALRFSEDQIEIPLDRVVPNREARRYHRDLGWETPNPCFTPKKEALSPTPRR